MAYIQISECFVQRIDASLFIGVCTSEIGSSGQEPDDRIGLRDFLASDLEHGQPAHQTERQILDGCGQKESSSSNLCTETNNVSRGDTKGQRDAREKIVTTNSALSEIGQTQTGECNMMVNLPNSSVGLTCAKSLRV